MKTLNAKFSCDKCQFKRNSNFMAKPEEREISFFRHNSNF